MQAILQKHAPTIAHHTVKVEWNRVGRNVTINFTVKKRDGSEWFADPNMSHDWAKNWGLWNNDVVEGFLQLRKDPNDLTAPYLEIQVSPLNQPFALIITEPRKTFFPPEKLNFTTECQGEDRTWTGKMTVELPENLQGEILFGGFFACLGPTGDTREFYALNPNPEKNPDFHRPELFVNLDQP